VEFGVYIPQVGLTFPEITSRAQRCEALGFDSFWLFDHLYAPGFPDQPALEGWTLATALLAVTTRLHVGHLVLDNNVRHPAVLGRMVSTLAHISGDRFELGLGSGSYAPEHAEAGLPWGSFGTRTARLAESLSILDGMFSGSRTTFRGDHFEVEDLPNPLAARPRLHIGGASAATLDLVARFADVWNVPTYALADWEARTKTLEERCAIAGRDSTSILRSLESVLVIASTNSLDEAVARAQRRYGEPGWGLHAGGLIGTPDAIASRVAALRDQGIGLLVFFPADRGAGDMVDLFAQEVMPQFR
jgi:alkanesulfonate monooxygenase SsuD/methylene tetrahydromethanopterin reductase-like flavin-dependent oxidoreductase (luciferase family)